jgi:hypothetical protein
MASKKKTAKHSKAGSKPDKSRPGPSKPAAQSKPVVQSKPGPSKSGQTAPVKSPPAQAAPPIEPQPARHGGGSPNPPAPKPDHKPGRSVMPTLLFYTNPIALNRETHKNLKVRSVPSFAYSANVNTVPLTANEFAASARSLPILFVPDANKNPIPVALLGLRRDENLFVEADGSWSGNYIPAFIRRYPFVLVETGKPNELTVGIDAAYPGFNAESGEPMFLEDGSEAPPLKRAIEFLNAYRTEAARTEELLAQIKRLDLLIPRAVTVQHKDGSTSKLDGFSVVDEQKLARLEDKEAAALLRSGHLGLIYMHLLSMHNMADLSTRLENRAGMKKSA